MSRASTSYDNISAGTIRTSTNVSQAPSRQPVIVINPTNEIEQIALSSRNQGYIIDANTPADVYAITLENDVSVGDSWKIWVIASSLLVFVNNTPKTLQTGGTVYPLNSYIYINGEVPPGAISPQPSNSATYELTITAVTDTTIRAVINVVFATLQVQASL